MNYFNIDKFIRSKNNPILRPAGKFIKLYNPSVITKNEKYILLYRAVDKSRISVIRQAVSHDGENFIGHKTIIYGDSKYETRGCEDPRLTFVDGRYFLTYTAYDGICARLSLAISDDLAKWVKIGPILPKWDFWKADGFTVEHDEARAVNPHANWSKAGGIFPEKINGKYMMLFGDSNIWLAESKDGLKWKALPKPLIRPRYGYFDEVHVEMGPAPLKTDQGWLVIYHGVDKSITYRLGFIMLDLDDPGKILSRSKQPVFEPKAKYEKGGDVDIVRHSKLRSDVVFANGAIIDKNYLRIYYGCGDQYIATAKAKINFIKPSSR